MIVKIRKTRLLHLRKDVEVGFFVVFQCILSYCGHFLQPKLENILKILGIRYFFVILRTL